jgi:hypothetical protein
VADEHYRVTTVVDADSIPADTESRYQRVGTVIEILVIGAAALNLALHLGAAIVDHFVSAPGERDKSVLGTCWLATVPASPPSKISGMNVPAAHRHVVNSKQAAVLAATKVIVVFVVIVVVTAHAAASVGTLLRRRKLPRRSSLAVIGPSSPTVQSDRRM